MAFSIMMSEYSYSQKSSVQYNKLQTFKTVKRLFIWYTV